MEEFHASLHLFHLGERFRSDSQRGNRYETFIGRFAEEIPEELGVPGFGVDVEDLVVGDRGVGELGLGEGEAEESVDGFP